MSLCVIYGPVASGKLTTAKAFARQTGFKLFHNHLVQDILVDLFPYEREELRDERAGLSRRIRKDILSAALAANIDVVMTMNYGGPGGLDLLRYIVEEAKKYERSLYIVRLCPARDVLDERVVNPSRASYAKANTPEILAKLLDGEGYGYEKFPDVKHLEIDNTKVSAGETAKRIIKYYDIKKEKSVHDGGIE